MTEQGPQTKAGRELLDALPLDEWHPINRDIVVDHILAIEHEAAPQVITDEQAEAWLKANDLYAVTHVHTADECGECSA